jgi:hypothetical protein
MLKKILIVCTTLMFVTLAGCKEDTHVVSESSSSNSNSNSNSNSSSNSTTTALTTVATTTEFVRPDYKNDGKETKAKINETVDWNGTGAKFTLKSAGISEEIDDISYVIFDILVENDSERTVNLSLLDDEIVLLLNGTTQISYDYKAYVKNLAATQNYFTIDESNNYLYNAGTSGHFYLPVKMPANLGTEFKVTVFPDYAGSPDYVTFAVAKDEFAQLTPIK